MNELLYCYGLSLQFDLYPNNVWTLKSENDEEGHKIRKFVQTSQDQEMDLVSRKYKEVMLFLSIFGVTVMSTTGLF